ncbi:MAG: hypothetical protein J0H57_22765, partial [Rhodospirillales bacterium]|nr:hypothetical protein [Rhodospirillales bacterium]
MIGDVIGFTLRNVPVLLLILSFVLALLPRRGAGFSERLLAWVLLLPLGVTFIWAAVFHLFFPAIAAADIGWQVSPFQFEVGMADLALGVTACLAVRAAWHFRLATVCAASIFLLGDAVGHVRQMLEAGNFAPGNAGAP